MKIQKKNLEMNQQDEFLKNVKDGDEQVIIYGFIVIQNFIRTQQLELCVK